MYGGGAHSTVPYFCKNVSNFPCQKKFVFSKHIVSVKGTLLLFQIAKHLSLVGRGAHLPCRQGSWTQGLRRRPASLPCLPVRTGANRRTFSTDPEVEPQFLESTSEFWSVSDWFDPTGRGGPLPATLVLLRARSSHSRLGNTQNCLFPASPTLPLHSHDFFFLLVGVGKSAVTRLEIGHCLNSSILRAENWKRT